MSAVSSAYDAVITAIESQLPNHKRLSNPYDVEENTDLFLRQGYGLVLGPGENSKRNLCNVLSIRRTFQVIISRKYAATELNASGKATTEKQIMEDLKTLIAYFETNTTLNTGVRVVGFESDSGIQFVKKSATDMYLFTEGIFEIEYFETI